MPLSPLSLLSSFHRDCAAVFIHRKAVFAVWRDGSGEAELLWKGERGGGGGWRERLLDVRMEVLGSPGLPGKRDSNPTHGTFQVESGSGGLR